MRILLVHNRYRSASPSGENRVVDQEAEALAVAGHEVRRLERRSDDIAALPPARRALVPVQVLWSRRAATDFDAELDRSAPDVVHVHNLFPLLSASVLQRAAARRVPCVVTVHNYRLVCPGSDLYRTGAPCRDCAGRTLALPGIRHGCYRASALATAPVALAAAAHRRLWRTVPSAYLFLSEAHRRELGSLDLPPERCFVKGNAVPPAPPRGAPEPLVVYLGRLSEAKGLRVLQRAWERFAADRPGSGLRLALAGAGPLDGELRQWAAARPDVSFLGLLDRPACAALVGRCRAVVVPSEWPEPFGLVVIEAMAAGVPALATDHGAFPELVTHGVDGFLYPPGSAPSLAGLLAEVAGASEARLAEMGRAALRTYRARFTPAGNVAALEAAYRFAVDHPRWLDRAPGAGTGGGPRVDPFGDPAGRPGPGGPPGPAAYQAGG